MDTAQKAGVVSAWFTAVSAIIALLAWWLPRPPDESPKEPDPKPAVPQGDLPSPVLTTATPAPGTSAAGAAVTYLDDMVPQAAGRNIVTLPRALRGKAEYSSHPLVIQCPSNQTGDETSNITFLLNGRYLRLDMEVRPYYPPEADQRSVTHVIAYIGVPEIDRERTTREAGSQKGATPFTPGPLAADVEGAEELTLKVACEDPRGVVVLTAARLTDDGTN